MFIIHVHNLWRMQYSVIYWLLLNRDSINKCLISNQIIFSIKFFFNFSVFLRFPRFVIILNNIWPHMIVLSKSPISSNRSIDKIASPPGYIKYLVQISNFARRHEEIRTSHTCCHRRACFDRATTFPCGFKAAPGKYRHASCTLQP